MVDTPARAPQSSTELAAAFDLLPTGIGVFSADYHLTYCNAAFGTLRGLPDALCKPGTPLRKIVHHLAARGDYGSENIDEQVERRVAEITGADCREFEQAIPGNRHLLISHVPTPGGGLMITYSDVTEIRATERKLRENEQRYGLVAEAVAEGIYDWNIEQNTLFVSARLMEIFGFAAPGLTSQNWFALVHAEDREGYRRALRDCFRGASPRVDCEYRILVTSGEYRWWRITDFRCGTGRDGQSGSSAR
jgi:PAS domain S-box-containing protein